MQPIKSLKLRVRRAWRSLRHGPKGAQQWVRVEMDRQVDNFLRGLGTAHLDAVEVSGRSGERHSWKSYQAFDYPEFDLLAPPDPLPTGDVVICEQVLEHVRNPWRGVEVLRDMCRPGGHVVISTPFLIRLHGHPDDYWRFTPSGMRELVTSAGLTIVAEGTWGNRRCIPANFKLWAPVRPWHRLRRYRRNDDALPQVVWAICRRDQAPM